MEKAGFKVTLSTFLRSFEKEGVIPETQQLEGAEGNVIDVWSLEHIEKNIKTNPLNFDMVILNNDLTEGVPDALSQTELPIYPSLNAGWHSRLKSHHCKVADTLFKEFAADFGFDPWFISPQFRTSKDVSINEEGHRDQLADMASDLFKDIQSKYTEYGIDEKPFIFLKSDRGTYGMGVHPIEDPSDILSLNRKARNQLSKGKSAVSIDRFILQEGIPSTKKVDHLSSEICVYQITNHFVGGFYRVNDQKSDRQNLNSRGMSFRKLCQDPDSDGACLRMFEKEGPTLDSCGLTMPHELCLYKLLARLSGIAAHREVEQLEECEKMKAKGIHSEDCP